MRNYIDNQPGWPLFVHGPFGVGKTVGAQLMAETFGGATKYERARTLFDRFNRMTQGELFNSLGYRVWPEEFWQLYRKAELAILDEVGASEPTSARLDCLMEFWEVRDGRPLILISNFEPDMLAGRVGGAVASRFLSGQVFKLDGADRRRNRV